VAFSNGKLLVVMFFDNITDESDEKLDDSDFPIHYKIIKSPTKRIEEA
jgi:hypothetical protein